MTAAAFDRPISRPVDEPGWAPLLVVLAGTFVTFLDFFIVNVALPSIRTDLHAGSAAVSLVVAGYGLTFAAGMITGGRLGDIHGRRRMFTVGLALFTLASAACGLAPTAGVLDGARLLQGAAGALLTPQVLALLSTVYAGDRRARAFAAYGFTMGIAAVLGQLVGGALIAGDPAGLGWRSIFLINVPVGLAMLPVVGRVVPESRGDRARLDLQGTLLGSAAVAALVLPLAEGREHGWPLWTLLSLVAAPVLAAAFVAHQRSAARRGRSPLIEAALFRQRSFTAGLLTATLFNVVPPSVFFVLALYLQQGRGYSPLFSGLVFSACGAGYFAALFVATPLTQRLGHQVLALGAGVVAAGALVLADAAHGDSAWTLTPGLALTGVGIGLVLVPLASAVLAGTDSMHAGSASGVLSTVQQVAGALGVALTSTVFFSAGPVVHAFEACLWLLAGVAALTAVLAQSLRTAAR